MSIQSKLSNWIRDDNQPSMQRAKQFLAKVGCKTDIKNPERFFEQSYKKYGETFETFMDLSNSRGEDFKGSPEIYQIKNSDFGFSLAMSSRFQGPVWLQWMDWFLQYFCDAKTVNAPERILDLGSDNGVVTCFMAACFPDAQIIGVERWAEGIEVSEKLASRLGLENLTFVQSDAEEFLQAKSHGRFDLINSLTFLKEAGNINPNENWAWTIEQKEQNPPSIDQRSVQLIQDILAHLENNESKLLLVERVAGVDHCRAFADHLRAAGGEILQTQGFRFENIEQDTERLTIWIIGKGEPAPPISFLEANAMMYLSYCDGGEYDFSSGDGSSNWILFDSLKGKQLTKGALLEFSDGSGLMSAEIWTTQFLTIWHARTVLGFGETTLYPLEIGDLVEAKFLEWEQNYSDTGTIHRYKTEEERTQVFNSVERSPGI
jgi:tRNA G46 methylase TrmB